MGHHFYVICTDLRGNNDHPQNLVFSFAQFVELALDILHIDSLWFRLGFSLPSLADVDELLFISRRVTRQIFGDSCFIQGRIAV